MKHIPNLIFVLFSATLGDEAARGPDNEAAIGKEIGDLGA